MRVTSTHVYFWGSVFSQFYNRPDCLPLFTYNNKSFYTAEHFMMYNKALFFNDFYTASKILETTSPAAVKKLGRQITPFDPVAWSKVSYDIVVRGNILKFSQNPNELKQLLAFQNHTFVEASPADIIWGVGLHESDDKILFEENWRGTNLLGKALNETATRLKGL